MAYVQVDGADIWYSDSGGGGPPLVLVHGAAGHSGCWVEQVPAFTAAGFRLITYDLRGFGRSRAEPGREADGSIAGDLEELARHLALGPFFLVAQAYGGFGAFEFALDNPHALRALVVSTSFGGLSDPEFTALRARYVPADVSLRPVEERELGATYRATNPEGVRRFLAMESHSYRGEGARQALRVPLTLERIARISVPTLLVAGEEDVLAPPPVMRAIAERIPGCRFEVIAGAGHCAYWEQPQVWNRVVIDFLKTVAASPKNGA
ncbi:MAG TPA: alpha/beta hydrolase [Dehalococcoidia bacterium]|nr:alpha/beta hydrolase [Dehalococcoidia bacterium]